jgi:hypothetical protein
MLLITILTPVLILPLISIASTSKNSNSDDMIAFRARLSARNKGNLMPAAKIES